MFSRSINKLRRVERRVARVVRAVKASIRETTDATPAPVPSKRPGVDLWGKEVELAPLSSEPIALDFDPGSADAARKAVLALNELYGKLVASSWIVGADHHVQQQPCYEEVLRQFRASGLPIVDFAMDAAAFEAFLNASLGTYTAKNNYLESQGGLDGYFPQKALEHWLSAEYLQWKPTDKVLDFAVWISPATEVLTKHRRADFFKHDMTFKTSLDDKLVAGLSDAIEAPDNYFDFVMAHCAIDNFEGDYDVKFIGEAKRILKPGGKLLITPLHVSAVFENRVALGTRGLAPDFGAAIVMGSPGSLRFARLYSVKSLMERLVSNHTGLKFEIVHVTGLPLSRYPATCTNRFMLVATKA